jgi:hypothetical protein
MMNTLCDPAVALAKGLKATALNIQVPIIFLVLFILLAIPSTLLFHERIAGVLEWAPEREHSPSTIEALRLLDHGTFDLPENRTAVLQLLFAGLAGIVLMHFLSAGVIATFRETGRGFSFALFFKACGAYLFRFAGFLLFFFFLAGLAVLLYFAVHTLVIPRLREMLPPGRLGAALVPLKTLPAALFFLFAGAWIQYAKILAVLGEAGSVTASLRKAFVFLWRNPFGAFALQLLLLVPWVVLSWIARLADSWVEPASWRLIAAGAVFSCLLLFFRLWIRVSFYSCQIAFYRMRKKRSGP